MCVAMCLCMCTGVSAPVQRGDRRPGPTRERSTLTSPNDRRRCTHRRPPPRRLPPSNPLSSHCTLSAKSPEEEIAVRVRSDDGERRCEPKSLLGGHLVGLNQPVVSGNLDKIPFHTSHYVYIKIMLFNINFNIFKRLSLFKHSR